MIPASFIHHLKNLFIRLNASYSFLLIVGVITLSSCDEDKVPSSFSYALGGTFAIMAVGLVIATFVTSRNKKADKDRK